MELRISTCVRHIFLAAIKNKWSLSHLRPDINIVILQRGSNVLYLADLSGTSGLSRLGKFSHSIGYSNLSGLGKINRIVGYNSLSRRGKVSHVRGSCSLNGLGKVSHYIGYSNVSRRGKVSNFMDYISISGLGIVGLISATLTSASLERSARS
jgi:hypothetical protein